MVSVKEPEKIVIQHHPETDEVVVDPLPTPLLEVLQSPGSDCDRCFASESVGGTLPPPRVAELKVSLLADPDNTISIGADPDVNSIPELCAAIVAAIGTVDPVSEQDIRDLLNDALENVTSRSSPTSN